jgi:GH25 family lysozyme M1 (1,4-beta-N-acetylmuramidase)
MSDVVIDLSHWETAVDFVQVKASGIAAVILKAAQGTGFVGSDLCRTSRGGKCRGLPSRCLSLLRYFQSHSAGRLFPRYHCADRRPDVALDFEPSANSQTVENNAAAFFSTVRSMAGTWPVLYTGQWDVAPAQPDFQQCAL